MSTSCLEVTPCGRQNKKAIAQDRILREACYLKQKRETPLQNRTLATASQRPKPSPSVALESPPCRQPTSLAARHQTLQAPNGEHCPTAKTRTTTIRRNGRRIVCRRHLIGMITEPAFTG